MKKMIIIFLLIAATAYSKEKALMIEIDGGVGPATVSYIRSGLETAEERRCPVFIIKLNTPGGLLESTRDIIQDLLEARVPVFVYVAPGGGRAGSAGVFITLAGHMAAMAPGTNIGAAHPVGLGGKSDTSAMFDKVTNDAAAFARTIAKQRGRNEDWAERAVRESVSSTETEALKAGVIDFIAPSVDSLMALADGRVVKLKTKTVKLETAGIEVEVLEMNWREKFLSLISDPNIAYALLMLGIYGIFFELWSPGSIFPGVAGGISIILAGYALQMLPVNIAGLALILLSIVLFILEVNVSSMGMLAVGGVISFVAGSVMLIDSPFEFMKVSPSVIITTAVVTTLFFLVLIGLGLKAQFRRKSDGSEGVVGEKAEALTEIAPEKAGKVKALGEIWTAFSDEVIHAGETVWVRKVDGLKLIVGKNIIDEQKR